MGRAYRESSAAPGVSVLHEVRHLDERGRLEFTENVRDGDRGWADTLIYDDAGRVAEAVRHVYADDSIQHYTYGYDANGNTDTFAMVTDEQTILEHATFDGGRELYRQRTVDGDGVYRDGEWSTTWDGDDRTRLVYVADDRTEVTTWTWSTPDHAVERVDRDADGIVEHVAEQVYDDAGRLQHQVHLDGEVVRTHTWAWDAAGNLVSLVYASESPHGWQTVIDTWSWNARGWPLAHDHRVDDGVGVYTTSVDWQWACVGGH